MPVEPFAWTLTHDGRRLTLDGFRSLSPPEGKPVLVFESGANIPPLPDCRELLDALDERFQVVGLAKNGLNKLGSAEPRTIDAYAALTVSFCRAFPAVSLLGHSLGFAVAYRAATQLRGSVRSLMGVAPLLPGKHSVPRFVYRFARLTAGMLFGTTGAAGRRYILTRGPLYAARFLRNPVAAFALIFDMRRVRFEEPVTTPTLILKPHTDELVPGGDVRELFPRLEWPTMPRPVHRHSLPLLFGREVARIVTEYHDRVLPAA